jgi:hypothetical protein
MPVGFLALPWRGELANPFRPDNAPDLAIGHKSVTLGRWFQIDPAGLIARDLNLYRYVANAPEEFTDPLGLLVAGKITKLAIEAGEDEFDLLQGPVDFKKYEKKKVEVRAEAIVKKLKGDTGCYQVALSIKAFHLRPGVEARPGSPLEINDIIPPTKEPQNDSVHIGANDFNPHDLVVTANIMVGRPEYLHWVRAWLQIRETSPHDSNDWLTMEFRQGEWYIGSIPNDAPKPKPPDYHDSVNPNIIHRYMPGALDEEKVK